MGRNKKQTDLHGVVNDHGGDFGVGALAEGEVREVTAFGGILDEVCGYWRGRGGGEPPRFDLEEEQADDEKRKRGRRVERTWTDGSAVRRFSSRIGRYESRTSGHLAAIWPESSTRTRTETASPGMAGLENGKECGEVMLGRGVENPSRDLRRRETRESGQNGPEGRHGRGMVRTMIRQTVYRYRSQGRTF